jgi:hypothetical protein
MSGDVVSPFVRQEIPNASTAAALHYRFLSDDLFF